MKMDIRKCHRQDKCDGIRDIEKDIHYIGLNNTEKGCPFPEIETILYKIIVF